jgi:N utilization substance protein B
MGARSVGRECALQILFGVEITEQDAATATRAFFSQVAPDSGFEADEEAREYAAQLVAGVCAKRDEIDDRIRRASTNWRLERMSRVDRNVLRLGAWELVEAVPRAVAIDEAVELAKRFGTEDSGAFVNGVLSRVADEIGA